MHPPDAAIRAARLSLRLQAAQHLLKRSSLPSSRLLCLPLSGAAIPLDVPDAAAAAAPPHSCSNCACLHVMPDKPRLCILIVGTLTSECDRVHCMDAAAIPLQVS